MIKLGLHFMGRTGNQIMQYLFARGFAEKLGMTLHTDPWIGESVFEIEHPRIDGAWTRVNEHQIWQQSAPMSFRGYAQLQKCVTYTRKQARQWLTIRPRILDQLHGLPYGRILAHRRVGDYAGYGYPIVSESSYLKASRKFINRVDVEFVTEENPCVVESLGPDLAWVPDFVRMIRCEYLFRGNSTFSWVAGLLRDPEAPVWSPVIDGLEGGKEHDCQFVPGNSPRLCNLEFVSDLTVKES